MDNPYRIHCSRIVPYDYEDVQVNIFVKQILKSINNDNIPIDQWCEIVEKITSFD